MMKRSSRGSEQRPVASSLAPEAPEATPPPRTGAPILTLLSVVTVLWLTAQFLLAIQGSNNLYPITNYSMFASGGGWPETRFQLVGTDASGTPIEIQPEELALTRLQLNSHLVNQIGRYEDDLAAGAERELRAIAQVWTDRHGTELVGMALWRLEYWPGTAGEPRRFEVAQWEQ